MEKYRIDPTKGMEFGLIFIGEHLIPNPVDRRMHFSASNEFNELIEASKLAERRD